LEGKAGSEQIHMYSPFGETTFSMGSPPEEAGFFFSTLKNWLEKITGNMTSRIHGNFDSKIDGKSKCEVVQESEGHQIVPFRVKFEADWRKVTVGATHETFVGAKSDLTIGTLLETRTVNHTEIKVGTHFEVKKAL